MHRVKQISQHLLPNKKSQLNARQCTAAKNPTIAVLSAIPNIATLLSKELTAFPVRLLSNPASLRFDQNLDISQLPSSWLSDVNGAQIIVCDPEQIDLFQKYLNSVRWIQSTYAGPDKTVSTVKSIPALMKRVDDGSMKITRFGSKLSMPMSEYVVGQILRIERKFDALQKHQNNKTWSQREYVENGGYRSLSSVRFAILGAGEIGCCIANSLKNGFGAQHIIGLSRTDKSNNGDYLRLFTKCYQFEQLDDMLENEEIDYLISVLPHTPQTQHLLDADRLKKCKTKPWLINIGRGSLIRSEELLKALDLQIIDGAVLDVFEEEPLPQDCELWSRKNVIITPHVAALSYPDAVAQVFAHNLKRYLKEQELDYLVDIHRGY